MSSGSEVSFLFSDFHLQRSEIEEMIKHIDTPILAAGEAIADPGVVHLFDSQEAFDHWALQTRFASKFEEMNAFVRRARSGIASDPPERSVRVVSNTRMESNWEILKPAKPASQDRDALVTLYAEKNYSGRSFTTGTAAISDLADIEFFQSVSSISVSGVCLLTDRVVFGGARIYLVGDPKLNIADLQTWGFSNCAASALIL